MKAIEKKKFLIIGGGLAGITLSHRLLNRHQHVTLIDDGLNASTKIAAGMVNPIVFRRTTLSWRATEFLAYSWDFYKALETQLNTSFAETLVIKRIFPTINEKEEWKKKQGLPDYQDHLLKIDASNEEQNHGIVRSGYVVHAEKFYIENQVYFEKTGVLQKESFDDNFFSALESTYRGIKYDHIVFCCGYRVSETPFFQNCQVKPTKGQTLVIKHNELPETASLHLKCFVFPMGEKTFRIGATYEWDDPTLHPTEEARITLLDNLSHITKTPPEIVSQPVGIRPTTMDRRPVLGSHPTYKTIHIFNGLGAKGYLLAPKMAQEMVEYLLDNIPIPKDYNLIRYQTPDELNRK